MHFKLNQLFLIPIFMMIISENVFAQSRLKNPRISKVGFLYQTYSGDKNISLADGAAGYGAEMMIDAGGDIFRYFTKAKIIYSQGTQNFLDNGTEVKSNYKLTQVAPEVGLAFYPVARKNSGLNLYIWVAGIATYQFVDLTPISSTTGGVTTTVMSYTKLKNRDQGYGYGAGGGIGFDAVFSMKSRVKSIYGEVGFRDQIAQVAGRDDFQIKSINFIFGFGF
jgi:hypothetical protein